MSKYHLQGVKIELQFIRLFIRFWTHNLTLHYITRKFFSTSSCGGILILPLLLTVSSFLFSPFLGSFYFFFPGPSTFFSFLQHKYILVDGVNIVPNFTLMSSCLWYISFYFIFDVLGLIILLRFFFCRWDHLWSATSTGWCQLYNLKDMIAQAHLTYSLMCIVYLTEF